MVRWARTTSFAWRLLPSERTLDGKEDGCLAYPTARQMLHTARVSTTGPRSRITNAIICVIGITAGGLGGLLVLRYRVGVVVHVPRHRLCLSVEKEKRQKEQGTNQKYEETNDISFRYHSPAYLRLLGVPS